MDLFEKLVNDSLSLQDELIECRGITEGIVVNTDKEAEAAAIKKLTEEEGEEGEEVGMETDDVDSEDSDVVEDGEKESNKQYFGKSQDVHYYLAGFDNDNGEPKDLQIVDQEGKLVYSAKDKEIDINSEVDFIINAIQDIEIEDISYDIFEKYIVPELQKDEEEEDVEDFEEDFEEGDDEESMLPDDEDTFESVVYSYKDKNYEIKLLPENKISIGGRLYDISDSTLEFYGIKEGKANENALTGIAKDFLDILPDDEFGNLKEASSCDNKAEDKEDKAEDKKPKKKVDEDISADVKALQKEAEDAVKNGDYVKAASLVGKLSIVDDTIAAKSDVIIAEPAIEASDEPIDAPDEEVADDSISDESTLDDEGLEAEIGDESEDMDDADDADDMYESKKPMPNGYDMDGQVGYLKSLLNG